MSQRGIGFPRADILYKLAGEGQDYFVGRLASAQGGGNPAGRVVGKGVTKGSDTAFAITKVIISTQGAATTSSQVNDTTDLLLVDEGGTTRGTLSFLTPHRNPAIFSPVMTQTLPNGNLVWEPVTPLFVPPNWSLQAQNDATQACEVMAFGFNISESDARALGYDVTNVGSPTTAHNWFCEGAKPSSDTTTVLVTRRAGYAIRIDDIVMRMMPATASGTVATVKLQKSDGTSLFEWGANGDNGEPIDKIIRGPIYLDPADGGSPISNGYGLNVTSTNCAGRFTIVVKGAFIPYKDVPDDVWFARVTPSVPTPATGLVAAAANLAGNAVATTIKAAPGKGRQLIVEGIDFSACKDATVASGTVSTLLGTGTAADAAGVTIIPGSQSYNSALVPLIATLSLNSHHQRKNITVDRVNLPCGDNKMLLIETGVYNFLNAVITPVSATTGDFDHFSVTCWGRIRPTISTDQGTAGRGFPYHGA